MNKYLKLIFYSIITITLNSGCNSAQKIEEKPSFKFSNINLDQVDTEGNKQFKLVTDRAYIIESSKHMKAIDPLVIFYYKNEPYYNLNSSTASIVDNGNRIVLDNKVYMASIRNDNFSLETDKVEWIKENSEIIMEGEISAIINNSSIVSNKATYDYKNNTITFTGIKQYNYKDLNLKNFIAIKAESAIWFGNNNRLLIFSPKKKVISKLKIYQ